MSGELRRPPQLWEQRLARTTSIFGVGVTGGDTTSLVPPAPPPGSGGGTDDGPTLPPPGDFIKPSTPTLLGAVQGIRVSWDGLNSAGDLWPYDTSWVEVHMSTAGTGFTVGTATLQGRLARPGGLYVGGLTAGTTYYFRLQGVDPAGNVTEASDAASGQTGLTTSSDYGTATIGSGAVSFNARQIGGVTNTVGAVAPSNPLLNDVWLDSSPGTAIIHKIWNGSTWVTNAWGSASIAAGQITALQIAAGAVTAGAIAAGAITADKIQAGAVTADKLTAGTIAGFYISGGTINAGYINGGTVNAAVYTGGSIASSTFTGGTISGSITATGTVSGAVLTGGSISGGYITGGTVEATAYIGGSITESIFTGGTIAGNITATGTVTGATLQTGSSGSRVVFNDAQGGVASVSFFNSSGSVVGYLQPNPTKLFLSGNLFSASNIQADTLTADNGIDGATLDISGAGVDMLGVYNNNTTGLDNVGITTDGRLRRLSSTQAIKYGIAPVSQTLSTAVDPARVCDVVTVDPAALLDVAVTEFSVIDHDEPTDRRVLGFIAEDVADKMPIAVSHDADGNPAGVLDTSLLAALVAVVQEQQTTITDLRARIEALEA